AAVPRCPAAAGCRGDRGDRHQLQPRLELHLVDELLHRACGPRDANDDRGGAPGRDPRRGPSPAPTGARLARSRGTRRRSRARRPQLRPSRLPRRNAARRDYRRRRARCLRTVSVTAADLDVERVGSGPSVVFVHGSIVGAERTWRKQRALAGEWTLVLPNRPGFAASPELERGDFDAEAPLIAELLGDSSHLVGHSYGAVIALLAAGLRPEAVRSLIVSEPGLLRLAAGDPVADAMIARGEDMYRRAPEAAPRDFLLAFRSGVHSAHETPDQLPDWLERGARHAARERPPWHADAAPGAL